MHIVLFFYFDAWRKFNPDHHGKGLQIINENRCVKVGGGGYNSCIYGEELRATQCDRFDIKIKWIKKTSFFFGFITSTIKESIKDWQYSIGRGDNKKYSVGILVNSYFNYFKLCDPTHEYLALNYKAPNKFKINDIFMLSFNLKENELYIYHNGVKIK
eukprot:UN13078